MTNQLFGTVTNPHEWVYHYTTRQTALEALLPSGTLRMGPFSAVNDPRESKTWSFSTSSTDEGPPTEEFLQLQSSATNLVKGHCKVLCMSQDDPRVVADGPDAVFHRGFSRPRMWAQYAGNHSGVCLVFDRNELHSNLVGMAKENDRLYSGPVDYVNMHVDDYAAFNLDYDELRASSLEEVVRSKVERYGRRYFFSKAEDWSSELEWRWVLASADTDPVFVPIGASLRAIVLGVDFPRVYEPAVVPLAEAYEAHVSVVRWRNGMPLILPGPYAPDA